MKKQVKENPMFKNEKKVKKLKNTGITTGEDDNEIKRFIIILVVLVVVIGATYFITNLIKKEDKTNDPVDETVSGEVVYDRLSVGMLLNRPYDEYYVLVYNADTPDAVLYSNLITKQTSKKDATKIYFCDLNNKLNSPYYNVNNDGKSNPNAKTINELNFGDLTLITVKKGKITSYVEDYEKIKEILK